MNRNGIFFILLLLIAALLHTAEAQHGGGQSGAATGTTTRKKHGHSPNFSENPILTDGTLFYIAISISFGLWCTGYGLDYAMDRHEKQANSRAYQKYTQVC
ncbi:hypothetical protein BJV82DRAFT_582828 [Fennellomyces sp. T-0311]|nr:hypothetical protein BJV82DRAFT_582828 [Fennellomyces sp. T-0311]